MFLFCLYCFSFLSPLTTAADSGIIWGIIKQRRYIMDKKLKIRLVAIGVALCLGLVTMGFFSGIFAFWAKGYDLFFDSSQYIKKTVFLNEEVTLVLGGDAVSQGLKSPASDKSATLKVRATVDGGLIKVTFYHDYSLKGGVMFTAGGLAKTDGSGAREEAFAPPTLTCEDYGEELLLMGVRFYRDRTEYLYDGGGAIPGVKVILSGVVVYDFEKR